jgi:hypothetical protein
MAARVVTPLFVFPTRCHLFKNIYETNFSRFISRGQLAGSHYPTGLGPKT